MGLVETTEQPKIGTFCIVSASWKYDHWDMLPLFKQMHMGCKAFRHTALLMNGMMDSVKIRQAKARF